MIVHDPPIDFFMVCQSAALFPCDFPFSFCAVSRSRARNSLSIRSPFFTWATPSTTFTFLLCGLSAICSPPHIASPRPEKAVFRPAGSPDYWIFLQNAFYLLSFYSLYTKKSPMGPFQFFRSSFRAGTANGPAFSFPAYIPLPRLLPLFPVSFSHRGSSG